MTRGKEGTSTNQACRRRGPVRGTRSTSHIVSSLTVDELRSYCEVPKNIDLKLMDKPDESTLGGEHNAVFFSREQLGPGFVFQCLPLLNSFCTLPGRRRPLSIPMSSVFSSGAVF